MQTSSIFPANPLPWPEPLRSAARAREQFPWMMVGLWLLPGLLLAAVLLGMAFFFEQRASKQIIYLIPAKQLVVARADGLSSQIVQLPGIAATSFKGMPAWAPDGSQWAIQSGDHNVLLVRSLTSNPITITVDQDAPISMGPRPWSADGAYLALRATKAFTTSLRIINVAQDRTVSVDVHPASGFPLRWSPARSELLSTVITGSNQLALQVVSADGQVRLFAPEDQQKTRMAGVWSPDGGHVAYVAAKTPNALGGSIWTARSDGGDPKLLMSDGANFAPIWSPRGDMLFFTHAITTGQTVSYNLYRMQADGQNKVKIGTSVPPDLVNIQDQIGLISWSPDGQFMYYQSVTNRDRSLYVAIADGSGSQLVVSAPVSNASDAINKQWFAAVWSPTSRGILISDGFATQLYWCKDPFDQTRRTQFPLPHDTSMGVLAWQP